MNQTTAAATTEINSLCTFYLFTFHNDTTNDILTATSKKNFFFLRCDPRLLRRSVFLSACLASPLRQRSGLRLHHKNPS